MHKRLRVTRPGAEEREQEHASQTDLLPLAAPVPQSESTSDARDQSALALGTGHRFDAISVQADAPTTSDHSGADLIQRAATEGTPSAQATQQVEQALTTTGQPLDDATRAYMEPRFGHDFSQVRVHTDERAATSADAVSALAYTVGHDVVFASGQYTPGTGEGQRLLAHELAHVAQQDAGAATTIASAGGMTLSNPTDSSEREAENVAASISGGSVRGGGGSEGAAAQSLAPVQRATDTRTLHRAPKTDTQADTQTQQSGALTVQTASDKVQTAYRHVFANQRVGLERLHDALQKKEAEKPLIASLAAGAVGAALGLLLGPVGPMAEALVLEEDEVGKAMIKKSVDWATEKAIEGAKERVTKWASEGKESDPIDNFIEAQGLALNKAEAEAIQGFLDTVDGFNNDPHGPQKLRAMEEAIEKQSDLATSQQIASSAGTWAKLIAKPGDDSRAWANDDEEGAAERGAIEIDARVKNAPISGPGDIEITGANWKWINKETERVVREHGGALIETLGANLRITIDTPYGETRCEVRTDGEPIIPEKSTLQGAMVWITTGQYSGRLMQEDRIRVVSAALALGYHIQKKSVSELKFG